MSISYEDYLKKIRSAQAAQQGADISASDALYDAQKQAVTENYEQQIKDTALDYETALKRNEVQKLINERAVARRSAELGLTDSGLNRTGQLAVQLSYANNKGNIEMQRQKAVDTLAATMRAKITELDLGKQSAAAGIKSSYDKSAMEQATKMYKSDLDAANNARSAVKTDLSNSDLSDEQKKAIIIDYINKYFSNASDADIDNEIRYLSAISNIPYEYITGINLGSINPMVLSGVLTPWGDLNK